MSGEHGRYVYNQYGEQYAYSQPMQYESNPQPTQPPPMRTIRSGSSSQSTHSSPQINHYNQHPSSQPSYYPQHPAPHGHHQQQNQAPPQSSTPQWGTPTDGWPQHYGQSYASQVPPVEPQAPQYVAASSRQAEPPPPAPSHFDQRGSYQYAYSQVIPAQVHHIQAPQPASYNDTQPRRAEERQSNIPPPLSSSSSSSLSANLPPPAPPPTSSNPPHASLASVTHHHSSYPHPSSLHQSQPLPQAYQSSRHTGIPPQGPPSTQTPAPPVPPQQARQQHHPQTQQAPQYYNTQYQAPQPVQAAPPPPPPVPVPVPQPTPVVHSPYNPYPPPEPPKSTEYNPPVDYGRPQEYGRPNEYKPSNVEPPYRAPKREKNSPAATPLPPPPPPLPQNPTGLDFMKAGVLEGCDVLSQPGAQTVFGGAGKGPEDALERMLQHATYGAQMLEAAVAALSPQPVQPQQQPSSYTRMTTTRPPSGNSMRNHDSQSHSPMDQQAPPHSNANVPPPAPQQPPSVAPTHVTVTPAPVHDQGSDVHPPSNSPGTATPGGSVAGQPKKKKEPALPGEGTMQLTIHQHNPDGTTTTISGGPPAKEANAAPQASRPPSNGGGGSHKRQKHDAEGDGQTCLGCGATSTPEWRRGPMGPRTLCNACGLVYAKLIKKRAKETNPSSSGSSSGRQKNHSNAIPGVPNVNGVSTSVMDLGTMHPHHRDGSGDGDSDYGGRS